MGYKVIIINNPAKLSVRYDQLVVKQEDEVTLPLEDISTLIIDTPQCSLTGYLYQILAKYKICLIACNEKHVPTYISMPYFSYCRELEVLKAQLSLPEPTKKRIWQKIVQQKIINSSEVLKDLYDIKDLDVYINKVTSGDIGNVESQAARAYWKLLFTNFKRHGDCKRNKALNYIYAIIRSVICKQIAACGLIPALGVHHCSELNNFNLADDLIEPFRALADYKVVKSLDFSNDELSYEERGLLANILNENCIFEGREITVQVAIEYACSSFCNAIKKRDVSLLKLPELKRIEK